MDAIEWETILGPAGQGRGYICFGTRILDEEIARRDGADAMKLYAARDTARGHDRDLIDLQAADPEELAQGLQWREIEAMSRLLPNLLCGEESAVLIFQHESRRMDRQAEAEIARALLTVALEEERHEMILGKMSSWLPAPPDLDAIRKHAQKFFVELGFSAAAPELRLAQICALDGCVSRTLAALLKRSTLRRSPVFNRYVERIRKDEANHVRITRDALGKLGVPDAERRAAAAMIHDKYVALLAPVADAFDAVEVDPDWLFEDVTRKAA